MTKEPKIGCSIFQKQEAIIKDSSHNLNNTKDYQRKIELAADLSRYVDILLDCPEYNSDNLDCKNCRFISNLRKRTAILIIKAKKLA